MQLCATRSCGVFMSGDVCKVARGADHRHTQVRPDTHCNHVLRDLLATAHARIKALGNDVRQAVV